MRPERWNEVVALFEAVLARPVSEREQFLNEAAGEDAELLEQVDAMLRANAASHPLLDATAGRLGSTVASGVTLSLSGQRIGAYEVVREIGRGGMATVYLANDEKHRRSVALKLLHADASSALGGGRFRREIEVVARLQHPHILPLYDSGETNGLLYYVMPLVSGESLRERIARHGPLPIDEVRRLTADVAAALDYAHRRGVIHRDVKPANILVDEEHATVADFGIAHRLVDDTTAELTATGIIIGTPAYMSPEQATGARELDARSDIYSLACVVFEMLTGKPPYTDTSARGVILRHLQEAPPAARSARPSLPLAVDEVLGRAMAKAPDARFGSTREFAQALDAALSGAADSSGAGTGATLPPAGHSAGARRRLRRLAGGAIAAGVAAIAFTAWLMAGRRVEPPSIAVLPFTNMSADPTNEYFSDGVTEELTAALAQLGRIRVTPRTTAFAYKGRSGDLREIGRELSVSRLLEGGVRRDGDRVSITTTLYDARTGERLWGDEFERDWGAVLALQNDIAGAIVEQLKLRLNPEDREMLAERHTVNADAYDRYLLGRAFFDLRTAASLEQAEIHFNRALEIDSLYARAHAGLADTYSIRAWTGGAAPTELFAEAERHARRALALDSTIAEAHLSLALIQIFHTWDWPAAERATSRAIALDSTFATAWFFRTWHLVAQDRMNDAMDALQRARQLEPLSLITNARIGTVLSWMNQYEAADSALRRTLEIDASYPVAQVQLARVLSLQGRHAEAIAALPPDSVRLGSYESGIAGFVHARAGRRDLALAAARALEARPYVPAEGVAVIYAALGDNDAAFRWLDIAVDTRGVGLIFLAAEPVYAPLRSDPRFPGVLRRIGLTANTR
jgi:serine/threonine-protein kinase